jgi:hypothetical protein
VLACADDVPVSNVNHPVPRWCHRAFLSRIQRRPPVGRRGYSLREKHSARRDRPEYFNVYGSDNENFTNIVAIRS